MICEEREMKDGERGREREKGGEREREMVRERTVGGGGSEGKIRIIVLCTFTEKD